MYFIQNYVLSEILKLSENTSRYQDTTILCKNGKFKSNSFLLSAIFPIFRRVLSSIIQNDEPLVISMPDIDKSDLEIFFQCLYKQFEKFSPSKDIQELLDPAVTFKDEPMEFVDNLTEGDDYSFENINPNNKMEIKDNIQTIVIVKSEVTAQNFRKIKIKKVSKKKSGSYDDGHRQRKDDPFKKQCNTCNKVFLSRRSFGKHKCEKKIHHCTMCDHKTYFTTNLVRHIQTHHSEEHLGVPCHACGKLIKSSMSSHLKTCIIPEGEHKCEKCRKCFPMEEKDEHVCETFVCNLCGHMVYTQSALSSHHKTFHKTIEKIPCIECGKEIDKVKMKSHLQSHEAKSECPECGVKVRKLESHMKQVHTPDEEKKFQCQDCGKGFMEERKLEIHRMNVHLKLRPYNCRYGCDISYNDTSNRNAHEKKTHGKLFTTVKEEKMKSKLIEVVISS